MGNRRSIQVGTRFGRLVVLEGAPFNKKSYSRCRCDCGKEKIVANGHLCSNGVQSCGCLNRDRRNEIPRRKLLPIGGKFGRLTVISIAAPAGLASRSLCRCECGTEKILRNNFLRSGKTRSCGCLQRDLAREKKILPTKKAALNALYCMLKNRSKSRGLAVEISKDDVLSMMEQECFYCGLPPSNISTRYGRKVAYSGIDRMNNSKGYIKGNVVACCKACNVAKNYYSTEEYIERCEGVAARHGK